MKKWFTFFALSLLAVGCSQNKHSGAKSENNKLVGLAYTTWHQDTVWHNVWDKPELGFYKSDNVDVIRQHARWIEDAGVDFIFVDWSNNVDYVPGQTKNAGIFDMIENATTLLFEEYAKMEKSPKISIMAGVTGYPEAVKDGRLQRKVDQIYNQFIANTRFKPIYQTYLGKPLLMLYVNTPSPFQSGVPEWTDDRFTVRWVTGYIAQQKNLMGDDLVSKYGYWSWEDRGKQTYTLLNGKPEAMTIVAAWREDNGLGEPFGRGAIAAQGRKNGETFKNQWDRAREIGVNVALVVSWNEWVLSEQPSKEISKDIEPSEVYGHLYLNLLKEEIKKFKN